ncbi:D-alanyl-D-alanine carboxypeptidase family protein [uncultured Lamprocystis sp.]|jgi:D-alanyl-D-alanine carboxypeptidase (penicillin-binding protein 5/6)|uniref:D-alanyl-D-alanine carboxypeptidase family protein n=1 Tax=uncultured Lamprocystis sp. TaxID=543132 RepID=UPI0025DF28F6|nr:D-alanyl-D-alanine carboxypeptidase family protein [uncultured Lamprocystis sp.]
MKLHPALLLCLIALLPAWLGAQGASSTPTNPSITPPTAPQAAPIIPAPPQIEAKGYLLVDFNTGAVLAESNADLRLEPASLTKIMTGYTLYRELAEGHVRLTDQVLISENAWRTGGSKMFVEVGKRVGLEDLLKGMIIQSGNDASVALSEHVAGSEQVFAELMNAQAQRLGMTNSHFVNVTGLPDANHYTTARDIAKVTVALIREFPQFYVWDGTKEYEYNGIKQHNRNRLLWQDPTVDGVKTGYTENAGYCLVASAKRDDMRLVSVVLGAKNPQARASDSLELLNYGFRFYESHRLYPGGEPVKSLRVWKGDREEIPIGPARDVLATIPRGRYAELSARMDQAPTLTAPIAQGARLGDIVVTLAGVEISRVPLVALEAVAEGGLWERTRDTVLQWF